MKKYRYLLILLSVFIPFTAFAAQPPKPVTVENDNSNPVPVSIVDGENGGQTTLEYRFVGATTTTSSGFITDGVGFGYQAMHRLCQLEVDQNARACFTKDMIRPYASGAIFTQSWVIPSPNSFRVIYNPTQLLYVPYETSAGVAINVIGFDTAFRALDNLSCEQFTRGDDFTSGLLATLGGISSSGCTNIRPIACCALVEVPVFTPSP